MSTSPHGVDAVPVWHPRRRLVLREVAALWRVVLSLPATPAQPPAGSGVPVLLVPGFCAGDWSLRPTARYLRRRGHRTFRSGIRANVACTRETTERLERRLRELHRQHGPVALVGHSRGGTLARLLATRNPGLVSADIPLGSPLTHQFAAAQHVLGLAEAMAGASSRGRRGLLDAECLRGGCADEAGGLLATPLADGIPLTSVYTRQDGIVAWPSCCPPDAATVRVRGTHNGLASNSRALVVAARALDRVAGHPSQTRPTPPTHRPDPGRPDHTPSKETPR